MQVSKVEELFLAQQQCLARVQSTAGMCLSQHISTQTLSALVRAGRQCGGLVRSRKKNTYYMSPSASKSRSAHLAKQRQYSC